MASTAVSAPRNAPSAVVLAFSKARIARNEAEKALLQAQAELPDEVDEELPAKAEEEQLEAEMNAYKTRMNDLTGAEKNARAARMDELLEAEKTAYEAQKSMCIAAHLALESGEAMTPADRKRAKACFVPESEDEVEDENEDVEMLHRDAGEVEASEYDERHSDAEEVGSVDEDGEAGADELGSAETDVNDGDSGLDEGEDKNEDDWHSEEKDRSSDSEFEATPRRRRSRVPRVQPASGPANTGTSSASTRQHPTGQTRVPLPAHALRGEELLWHLGDVYRRDPTTGQLTTNPNPVRARDYQASIGRAGTTSNVIAQARRKARREYGLIHPNLILSEAQRPFRRGAGGQHQP